MKGATERRIRPSVSVQEKQAEHRTVRLTEVFSVALLRASGIEFLGVEQAASGRVAFLFADPDGAAQALVREHQGRGVSVNSQDYAGSISWTRDLIFGTKG